MQLQVIYYYFNWILQFYLFLLTVLCLLTFLHRIRFPTSMSRSIYSIRQAERSDIPKNIRSTLIISNKTQSKKISELKFRKYANVYQKYSIIVYKTQCKLNVNSIIIIKNVPLSIFQPFCLLVVFRLLLISISNILYPKILQFFQYCVLLQYVQYLVLLLKRP